MIDWDNVKVIEQEQNWRLWIIKEAIHMCQPAVPQQTTVGETCYQMSGTLSWTNNSSRNHGANDLPMPMAEEGYRVGLPIDHGHKATTSPAVASL